MSYKNIDYSHFSCSSGPIFYTEDHWDRHIHSHTMEELLLIASSGHCIIDSNGSAYHVPTPAFIWNRAGSYHKVTNMPSNPRTSYLVAYASDLLDDIPQKLQYADFMQEYSLFAISLDDTCLNRLESCFSLLMDSPLTQRQLMLPCIFHQLTLHLKTGAVPIVSSSRHGYISQVLSLLENAGGEKMTSKQLAARFHVNRNKLEADFKQATGQTVYAFRTQLQLQSARVLLATTGQSLSEIASTCGFTDKSHLIRSFQKKFGVTPGVFRKQFRQNPRWQI